VILVIEDEPDVLGFVEGGLRRHNLDVDTATDDATGLSRAFVEEMEAAAGAVAGL
jgi:DNA-binding response OmpR family regulator